MSIINQQLSTRSAESIRSSLFEAVEVTPRSLLAVPDEVLRGAGLSGSKVEYVRGVARAFRDGRVRVDRLAERTDDEVRERLTSLHGVGDWTAKMFLIFGLGRPDVFAVEDLGIRRGMTRLFGDLTRAEMVERARVWEPYRSYACRYLWTIAHEDPSRPDPA